MKSAAEFHDAIRGGKVSLAKRVRAQEALADSVDPQLGVFNSRHAISESALQEAEDRILANEARPLEGLTLGIKDVISVAGHRTTGQSLAFLDGWGDGTDAEAVERLRGAGALIMGMVSTMELAYGVPESKRPFGYPRNPWSRSHFPGGSSSGSAVGVASRMFDIALGTDTGGSIRIPSAMSGATGFKPTFDAVSRRGVMTLGHTLDHVGPLAKNVDLCRDVFRVIAEGGGGRFTEPSALRQSVLAGAPGRPLEGIRVGVDRLTRHVTRIDSTQPASFDRAVDVLERLGATVVEIEVPSYGEQSAAAILALLYEARLQWGGLAQRSPELLNTATRILLNAASTLSHDDYEASNEVRASTVEELVSTFAAIDIVVTPTSHLSAPLMKHVDSFAPTSFLPSVHTGYWSGTGMPSLAVQIDPASNGLPLSMLINGQRGRDELVLAVGVAFQSATAHHDRVPSLST